jgi:hypothetical protein
MKTIKNLRLAFLVLISVVISQCVTNSDLKAQQEKRDIPDFSRIDYSISGDLEIIQGNNVGLMLEGDQKDLDKVTTEVENGALKVYIKNHFSNIGKIKVYVTVVNLEEINISGSCKTTVKSGLKTEKMGIHISGSGNVDIPDLTAGMAEFHISGSGSIHAGGTIKGQLEVHISGSGSAKASELQATDVEVHISGSGSAEVNANSTLESRISGSGSVFYKGNPKVDAESSGSGRTKPL